MKPTQFRHQNTVFAKNQDEYQSLPSLKLETKEGHVISCWKMTLKDRFIVLFTGRVWMSLLSFNKPLTPSYLTCIRKDIYSHNEDNYPFYKIFKLWVNFKIKTFNAKRAKRK